MSETSTIHQRIKQIRIDSGLSQKEFAARIKISRGSYSQIEYGNNEPTVKTLKMIRQYFNNEYSYEFLIDGVNSDPSLISQVMAENMKLKSILSGIQNLTEKYKGQ